MPATAAAHTWQILSGRAEEASQHLAHLSPTRQAPPIGVAFAHLQVRITEKEKTDMWKKIFSPRYRFAWVALGLLVVVGMALTIPSVKAIANSFLGLFRVQQVTFVPIDTGGMPGRLSSSSRFEALLAQNLQVEEHGQAQDVASVAEAGQLAGLTVRLPTKLTGQPALSVQPGASATFNIDLERIQAVLEEVGVVLISNFLPSWMARS